MGSDLPAMLRHGAVPFLAGAAAATALIHGFYATATVSLLVALWATALIGQAASRLAAAPPTPPFPMTADAGEQRRLRLYLDLSPAPLIALGDDDRLRIVNRAARRLLRADDLVSTPPAALIGAIRDTSPGRSTTVRLDAEGVEHAFAVVTADLDGAGAAVRVAALVDIDADLRAAEATTLRDLVKVLGHEITNTLTPIASLSASAAAMLAEPAPDVAAVRAAIDTVSRRALALQRFGEAYRDLARLPAPARQRFDLAALAGDLAHLFRTQWPAVELQVEAPAALDIRGDADQLAQAIWALLQNAAEAGRTVRLEIARRGIGATLIVADDGPGIADENIEAIFRPFFSTKSSGSGIGLTLTRQIFRAHDGDLQLVQATPSAILRGEL